MAKAELGLKIGFYAYPIVLFVTLLGVQSAQFYISRHGSTTRKVALDNDLKQHIDKIRRFYARCIWVLQVVLSGLLIASIVYATREVFADQDGVKGSVVFSFSAYLASFVGVLLYYVAGLLPDPEGPWNPNSAHLSAWCVGALAEIVIAAALSAVEPKLRVSPGFVDTLNILGAARVLVLAFMIGALGLREYKTKALEPKSLPEERRGLLENGNGAADGYGSVQPTAAEPRRTQVSGTGWLDYFAGFRVLFPYLWPKGSPVYQAIVLICIILLICQRTVNVLGPLQLGTLVDSLGEGKLPYKEIILYVVYRALQGNQGVLGAARSLLWLPVSQSLFRRLSSAAFEHVLGLSLEFHLNKKVGEVTSALSRGASINTFLESFCFQVFPMVFDIFVAGDTVLFNATIMYNLLYARPDATEADVYEACKAANIHERILNFPDGYETKVGERGLKLSGGERQRIAIARAILKDARILLLDEATASLDSHTERQIQDALERVTEGRTTITIAHRLSTITTSDQIIVLHKGKIVERGTHNELLAQGGRYHAMWEKQTTIEKKEKEKKELEGEASETGSQ
ncbi:ATP-binding cassette, subfamily B [Fusarium oxysporum f. sp. lycopersici 4287]|uniref:ATP-binding cassette, subfamily B n=1 Tax=Fusarium oxysporum f. sp. lycopersici (strain 4287 / CBS 123668 / FGSC 9935 / NRRL 34936) TaxID=426428 RepID=A0A0J9W8T6_FUSO4|nr:ATP-binding cassette, subfamily B [Fusarium oxysporum f. sp. lycopersici 4287]KNB19664.1 ATP-binding cassette, subfamily B [Fusarium oxysporum f. sp. lycopersici 4287]